MTKKRNRIDIYALIIETVEHSEGMRLTRISYAVGLPTDRARRFVDQLVDAGLIQPSVHNASLFISTKHGQKFLESYYVLKGFLEEIKEDIDEL